MMSRTSDEDEGRGDDPQSTERRSFLGRASSAAMIAGLAAGYGTLGAMAARFVYPAHPRETGWMFVTEVDRMRPGDSLLYRAPTGEPVAVTRQGDSGRVEDFIALSSTCPHLGCQVHWEAQNDRFFCPCHNGIFDRTGKGTGGPPGEAGQSLPRYPLIIADGMLFIDVPTESLTRTAAAEDSPDGTPLTARAGHDPCLGACPGSRTKVG